MKTMFKTAVLGAAFMFFLIGDLQLTPTLRIGLFSDANAVLGVRRRTARRTAVVVHSADEAAYAQANAAAAAATPAPAPAPAATAPGALPLGTIVSVLPTGCTPVTSGSVQYQHCGPDYYRATFQANNLVYVTAQP